MSTAASLKAPVELGAMTGTTNNNVNAPDNNAPTRPDTSVHTGYPKLAYMMSLDGETAIFRRFGELNMITLLRLQAELLDLERELRDVRAEYTKGDITKLYVRDFKTMRRNLVGGDSLQYELLMTIADKFRVYSRMPESSHLNCTLNADVDTDEVLFQVQKSSKIEQPSFRAIDFLRVWLMRGGRGDGFLRTSEADTWGQPGEQGIRDFVSLYSRSAETDAFTSFLEGTMTNVYHRLWGHKRHVSYHDLA